MLHGPAAGSADTQANVPVVRYSVDLPQGQSLVLNKAFSAVLPQQTSSEWTVDRIPNVEGLNLGRRRSLKRIALWTLAGAGAGFAAGYLPKRSLPAGGLGWVGGGLATLSISWFIESRKDTTLRGEVDQWLSRYDAFRTSGFVVLKHVSGSASLSFDALAPKAEAGRLNFIILDKDPPRNIMGGTTFIPR